MKYLIRKPDTFMNTLNEEINSILRRSFDSVFPEYVLEKETKGLTIPVDIKEFDTEYKIINDIANSLGNNTSAVGTIKLLTERPPCDSCANVIMQFTNKYKNIVIEVVDNGHQLLIP